MFDFIDQTVVVTGAGSGIGAATSRILASLGAHVIVTDVREAAAEAVASDLANTLGGATPVALDVTNQSQCIEALGRVVKDRGRLDVLITCAGWSETHPFLDEDAEYWQRVVDINLFGTIFPVHAALPHMMKAKYGRIVTVSSDAGRVGTLGETVYAAAKAGVMGFTKSIAREVGRDGVVANCVTPGVTDTPLMRHQDQTVIDKMVRLVTLKRMGQPEEVGAALVFFATREAGFITGQVLSVSGGLTMVG